MLRVLAPPRSLAIFAPVHFIIIKQCFRKFLYGRFTKLVNHTDSRTTENLRPLKRCLRKILKYNGFLEFRAPFHCVSVSDTFSRVTAYWT